MGDGEKLGNEMECDSTWIVNFDKKNKHTNLIISAVIDEEHKNWPCGLY